jgi:hypothetical protein
MVVKLSCICVVCVDSVCAGKYLYYNNVSEKIREKSGTQAGFFALYNIY